MPAGSATQNLDEAAHWVAKMDGDAWSDADQAALDAWLLADPLRKGALLRMQALWRFEKPGQKQPPIVADAVQRSEIGAEVDVVRAPILSRRRLFIGGAGAIAASVAGFQFLNARQVLRTGLGEIRHVPLDDGTIAAINTDSELEIAFSSERRDVILKKGEAWFQVAKNPQRPFFVQSGAVDVRAVGTAFSVRRKVDGVEVIVTEGVVETGFLDTDRNQFRLVEGQSVFLSDSRQMRLMDGKSANQALAWRDGRIELRNERLSDAIVEFNRYNRRQLILIDEALGERRLDGYFRTNDVDGFAQMIRDALDAPIRTRDDEAILIGARKV